MTRQRCLLLLLAAAALCCTWSVAPASGDHSVTAHVSQGTIGGNGPANAELRAASTDGSVALFETSEQLVPADTDTARDGYRRVGGVTELVTAGPASTGPTNTNIAGMSPDGSAVYFYTTDALVGADMDTFQDAYMYRSGTQGVFVP